MNLYSLLPLCACATNIALLLFAVNRGPRDDSHKKFVCFALTVVLWSFMDFIAWNLPGADNSQVSLIFKIQSIFILFTGTFFARFCCAYSKKGCMKSTSRFLLVPLSFSILSLFSNLVIADSSIAWWGVKFIPGSLFLPVILICFAIPVIYGMVAVYQSTGIDNDTDADKQKMLIIISGAGAAGLILFHFAFTDFFQISSALTPFLSFAILPVSKQHPTEIQNVAYTSELEVVNTALKQKTTELERLSHYKSDFLANMSHEIRTPMNGIIGFTEMLLLDETLPQEKQETLNNIKTCSDSLLDLVNDILDFSKIETDHIVMNKKPLNLGKLITEATEVCRVNIDFSNKDLELLIDDCELQTEILGDQTRLRQIFLNLIGNAVKFTEKGSVKISVKVKSQIDNDIQLAISVKDTGPGIEVEEQKRIFNAFEQGTAKTVMRYRGTGLGLTISKKLIELMGGQLKLKSEPGKGTDFFFELTFGKADDLPGLKLKSTQKVFVIEASRESRKIIKNGLKIDDGQLTENQSASSIKDGNCNILIVNVNDLDDSQIDTLNEKVNRLKDTPQILAILSDRNSDSLNKARRVNAAHYLVKPFYCRSILEKLCPLKSEESTHRQKTMQSLSILMAEDDPVNLMLQSKMLKNMGHKIDRAEDGATALKMGLEADYDLIFMDMQLPELNGLEVTKKLRDKNIVTPIIALTANAYESDKKQCLEAGMNYFLSKPVSLQSIETAVTDCLEQLNAKSSTQSD